VRAGVVLLAILVLAGCGGGGSAHRGRTVTIPSYAGFPPMTITGTYSAAACAKDAEALAREGRLFAEHSGPAAAYSADTYYIDMRRFYADFEARDCEPATLGRALRAKLTRQERSVLTGYLPRDMAESIAEALAR
jgi:hypothetical protein